MSGYVLVENNTGHAVHTSGCGTLFQILLTSSHYRPPVAWFTCWQPFVIPVGESRYPAPVRASYSECSQGRPQHGFRPCLRAGRPPRFPLATITPCSSRFMISFEFRLQPQCV